MGDLGFFEQRIHADKAAPCLRDSEDAHHRVQRLLQIHPDPIPSPEAGLPQRMSEEGGPPQQVAVGAPFPISHDRHRVGSLLCRVPEEVEQGEFGQAHSASNFCSTRVAIEDIERKLCSLTSSGSISIPNFSPRNMTNSTASSDVR